MADKNNASRAPTAQDVLQAAERIAGRVHRTPVFTSRSLNVICGAAIFFKAENMQKVGAFKFRGATNAVLCLGEGVRDGVVTHSSGNHAQALALAARLAGVPARIVMPENAPAPKRAAVEGYEAQVFFSEPTQAAREKLTRQIMEEHGGAFIHPYDNRDVIAGQGTAALELLQQVEGLDDLIAPVGGGGLLSGTLLAASRAGQALQVYGGEPAGADDAARSLAAGQLQPMDRPDTIADGLRTSLGELTFPIIRDLAADILLAEDDRIIEAMRLVWERLKLVVEPSGAVPLAAMLAHKERFAGRRVGIILSGGNVDLNHLPWRSS